MAPFFDSQCSGLSVFIQTKLSTLIKVLLCHCFTLSFYRVQYMFHFTVADVTTVAVIVCKS